MWKLLGAANVPEVLRELHSVQDLDCYERVLAQPLENARAWGAKDWYFVTGGDARRHRRALVTLLVELGVVIHQKSFWYDWAARIAVGLRDHMNDEDSVDLRHKLRTVPVLAIDHVNPAGWKPWFAEAMDEILYARAGKVTILGSSRSVLALQEALPLAGDVIADAVLVEIG